MASLTVCVGSVRVGPYLGLIWCSEAPQDLTQDFFPASFAVMRPRNAHFKHRRKARGLVSCRQIETYRPYARCLLVKFAAVSPPGIPTALSITRNEERSSAVPLGALTSLVVDSDGYCHLASHPLWEG
jgi:hypothetical protein